MGRSSKHARLPGIETNSKGIEHHELHRPTNGMFAQAKPVKPVKHGHDF
jgi:hypothetical protein